MHYFSKTLLIVGRANFALIQKILKEKNLSIRTKRVIMVRKNDGGLKFLKIAGGVLLIIGGIAGFSKFLIESNFIGVLISAIAFFGGIWLIGQSIE